MKQLIVEMADADMRALEKVARHRAQAPAELLREQVKIMVTAEREAGRIPSFAEKKEGQAAQALIKTVLGDQHAARERRLQILRQTSGLMKKDPNFPKDGLQYQTEVRAEWD